MSNNIAVMELGIGGLTALQLAALYDTSQRWVDNNAAVLDLDFQICKAIRSAHNQLSSGEYLALQFSLLQVLRLLSKHTGTTSRR